MRNSPEFYFTRTPLMKGVLNFIRYGHDNPLWHLAEFMITDGNALFARVTKFFV
jgi:hypothetical protein